MRRYYAVLSVLLLSSCCLTVLTTNKFVLNKAHGENRTNDILITSNKTIPVDFSEFLPEIILPTTDNHFILVNNDNPYADINIRKIDQNGELVWNNSFGGEAYEYPSSVIETQDHKYAILAQTESYGNGWNDIWLLKLNSDGEVELNKTFGWEYSDYGSEVIQTSEGNYVIFGSTKSEILDDDYDFLLLKVASSGAMSDFFTYHQRDRDYGQSFTQTQDAGYLLIGSTLTFGSVNHKDGWIIKTDQTAEVIWKYTYQSQLDELLKKGIQTEDENYVITGIAENETASYSKNFFVFKLNSEGNLMWDTSFGNYSHIQDLDILEIGNDQIIISGYVKTFEKEYFINTELLLIGEDGVLLTNKTLSDCMPVKLDQGIEEGTFSFLGIKYQIEMELDEMKVNYFLSRLEFKCPNGFKADSSISGFIFPFVITFGVIVSLVRRRNGLKLRNQ